MSCSQLRAQCTSAWSQGPLLSGRWFPSSGLPHGPMWLPELQESHHALGWKEEEGEEKDERTFWGLFPLCVQWEKRACSQAFFFCEI